MKHTKKKNEEDQPHEKSGVNKRCNKHIQVTTQFEFFIQVRIVFSAAFLTRNLNCSLLSPCLSHAYWPFQLRLHHNCEVLKQLLNPSPRNDLRAAMLFHLSWKTLWQVCCIWKCFKIKCKNDIYSPFVVWGKQSISSLIVTKIPSKMDIGFPTQLTPEMINNTHL